MVAVTPLGGASEIGASCTLVEAFGIRLVIDCGLRPGAKAAEDRYPDFAAIDDAGEIHAILVTHAHLDHVGGLPLLHQRLPHTPLFATPPTQRFAYLQLSDSVKLMGKEKDFEGDVDFTQDHVDALTRAFVSVEERQPVRVARTDTAQATVTYYHAGHVLGACMLAIEIEETTTGRLERVFFTGDISNFDQPTIKGMDIEGPRGFAPSILVCEGTYSVNEHGDHRLEAARMVAQVAAVLRNGGRVLIPAFALGRAQNVVLLLKDAMLNPRWVRDALGDPDFVMPEVPILVDGMCRDICDQYDAYRPLLAPERHIQAGGGAHVFFSDTPQIRSVRDWGERESWLRFDRPAVFVASSGMLNGGASVAYAKAIASDPKSAIYLCGYQDEESGGAALRRLSRRSSDDPDGPPLARLGRDEVRVRCQVGQYNLSGHADARGIEDVLEALRPQTMLLVHGTPTGLARLADRLQRFADTHGIDARVEVSHQGEMVEVDGTHSYESPAFYVPDVAPSPWVQRMLDGQLPRTDLPVSPASPYVSAVLRVGHGQPLTEHDVARLDLASDEGQFLGQADLLRVRDHLDVVGPKLWRDVSVGRERWHRPEEGHGRGALSSISLVAQRDRSVPWREVRGAPGLKEHWDRVRALHIGTGDLILCLAGTRSAPRLAPAVTIRETKAGFEVLSPALPDSTISVHQVVSRIGPWPNLSSSPIGSGSVDARLDARLLDSIDRALIEMARRGIETVADEESTPPIGRALPALWELVPRGILSHVAAAVASVLITQRTPTAAIHLQIADIIRWMGGPRALSAAQAVGALEELERSGLLLRSDLDEGLEIRWTLRALAGFSAHSEGDPEMRHLGAHFLRVLQRAYLRAASEVQRLGLQEDTRLDLVWLAPPAALSPGSIDDEIKRLSGVAT